MDSIRQSDGAKMAQYCAFESAILHLLSHVFISWVVLNKYFVNDKKPYDDRRSDTRVLKDTRVVIYSSEWPGRVRYEELKPEQRCFKFYINIYLFSTLHSRKYLYQN